MSMTDLIVSDMTMLAIGLGLFCLPLLAGLILIFFGRKLPRGGDWVAQTSIVACAVACVWLFWQVIVKNDQTDWTWWSASAGLDWTWIKLPWSLFAVAGTAAWHVYMED